MDSNIGLTEQQLDQVRRTSMARIICDNTDDIDRIQPLAFKMPTSRANAMWACTEGSIPKVESSKKTLLVAESQLFKN